MGNRTWKDGVMSGFIYCSAALTVGILAVILIFVFVKGVPNINLHFLTGNFDDKTTYVNVKMKEQTGNGKNGYLKDLGITVAKTKENGQIEIIKIDQDSNVKNALDMRQTTYRLKKGDMLTKIGNTDVKKIYETSGGDRNQFYAAVQKACEGTQNGILKLKVLRPGGGIVPMLVTTIYMILLSLAVAAPIGILSAVYLNEYAASGRILDLIRFAIQNLAGIPSIIYGLFGSLFFVQICKMKYSILSGALTISIILLPVIISTTEEALKAIPMTYRESSRGLGATKLQTTLKVVLPNALPGILVAVILSIGRVVGESAALLLTAGTMAQIPAALTGDKAGGATLTIKMYTMVKEQGNVGMACAIGVILILLILLLNVSSKYMTSRFMRNK